MLGLCLPSQGIEVYSYSLVFVVRVNGTVVTARTQYNTWDVCRGKKHVLELFMCETK